VLGDDKMGLAEKIKILRDKISEYLVEPRWLILSRIKRNEERIIAENKLMYENLAVVKGLANATYILKSEKIILRKLKDKLKDLRMLDIGVGGGRTTHYFAKLTKEYVGVDYAKNMIKACKRKFANLRDASFVTCDVRFMPFKNGYFDFILFSLNGLDLLPLRDRIKTLKEIKRVTKENGYFCFSTHNIFFLPQVFSFKSSRNLLTLFKNIRLFILLRLMNRNIKHLTEKEFVLINDPSHNCKELAYYVRPSRQLKELYQLSFKEVQVITHSGKIITDINIVDRLRDPWLYYLCRV